MLFRSLSVFALATMTGFAAFTPKCGLTAQYDQVDGIYVAWYDSVGIEHVNVSKSLWNF